MRPYLKRCFSSLDIERKSLADSTSFPFLLLPSELRSKRCLYLFAGRTPRVDIYVSILRTCRQIHAEAEPELYSLHTFAFREETIGINPFLSSFVFNSKSPYSYNTDQIMIVALWSGSCLVSTWSKLLLTLQITCVSRDLT